MTVFAAVELTICSTGKRLYSSRSINRYSPDGSGPWKSKQSSVQADLGSVDMCIGSILACGTLHWPAMHFRTTLSTLMSMCGNQTFVRNICFVRVCPWCPSCTVCIARTCKVVGKTMRVCRNTILLSASDTIARRRTVEIPLYRRRISSRQIRCIL